MVMICLVCMKRAKLGLAPVPPKEEKNNEQSVSVMRQSDDHHRLHQLVMSGKAHKGLSAALAKRRYRMAVSELRRRPGAKH
jgi:hypothetical protein